MKLRYNGPFDEVEVAGLTVKRGHQFDVSDEVAGKPPDQRWTEAQAELADAVNGHPDHDRASKLRVELGKLDPGEGLLAQPDNFDAVTAKSDKPKDGDK